MQTQGPVAKVPRGDLDALAYGDAPAAPNARRQEPGFFSGRTFAAASPAADQPASETTGAVEPTPRVITAAAPAARSHPPRSSGGLIAMLGLRTPTPAADPMQSNAQMPVSYAAAPAIVASNPDYKVDAGDKLRVVVFGQEGLTNTYAIDAAGGITMPLIGRVVARGLTPAGLAAHITGRLRKGYIRDPSVAVEVETYRPFFILGEVAAPGQYPYVPNMSVEAAVAIAGGFSPRARRDSVMLTHKADGGQLRAAVPLGTPLSPGDTIMVDERWF